MSRPVLLIEIGAGPLPAVTPVVRPSGSWVPVVYKAPVVETPTGVTPTPVTDGVLLQWSPIAAADVVYIIDRGPTAEGPWVEIARTAATRYLYSDGTNVVWFFRIRASINGRAGGGNVVRVQLDMTTEKIRQEFLQATQRDQDLAKQLQRQAQDLANLQALVEAPEWLDQAWPSGSIVKHEGGLYVARQDVPVGTAITDTAYWSSIGQYASLAEAVGAIGVAMQQVTTDVQQVEQELEIVARDVRGVQSSLAGKADASAVQAMNTRLTQAENNISSLSQLISTVQSVLSGKADASAVQALQTQVTQIGNEVTSNSTAITQVRALSGTRPNLLVNGDFSAGTTGWSVPAGMGTYDVSVGRVFQGKPTGTSFNLISDFIAGIEPGSIYTFAGDSFLVANGGSVRFDILWYNAGGGIVGATSGASHFASFGWDTTDASRQAYAATGPAPSGAARARVQVQFDNIADQQLVGVRFLKFELGNRASAYSNEIQLVGQVAASQSMQARLTVAENGVASYFASWNLSLDVNGRIVGIRSVNNGDTGTIDFVFDKVRFLSPSAGGARAEMINGNYFVYAPNGVRVIGLGWSI